MLSEAMQLRLSTSRPTCTSSTSSRSSCSSSSSNSTATPFSSSRSSASAASCLSDSGTKSVIAFPILTISANFSLLRLPSSSSHSLCLSGSYSDYEHNILPLERDKLAQYSENNITTSVLGYHHLGFHYPN